MAMGGATRFFVLLTTPFPLLHHRSSSLLRLSRHHKLFLSPSLLSSSSSFHHLTSSPSNSTLLPPSPLNSSHHLHNQTASSLRTDFYDDPSLAPNHTHHPWSEWSTFIHHISASGYFQNRPREEEEEEDFVAAGELTHLFLREARACLAFARDRQNILRLLSRRDIEVVVEHGSPFLFRNAEDSARKMRSFIANSITSVLDSDKAYTVDLMKYMLSYASNPLVSSERNNVQNRDLVESSVRNLFAELFKLICNAPGSNSYGSVQNQMPGRFGQKTAPGQKIEMKRGDWICPRCNFMNFARNIKCLECEETRPKRQLTGGEWECPQCDFFNYGRNMTCMRCDCKRPGQTLGATNTLSGTGYGNGSSDSTSDIDYRLAANEEKAQRWFSKVSQLDSTADINSVISDEDFPEIMPLRKGVNRFVVSTKKTPLERRLTNTQYQRNLGNDGTPEYADFQAGEVRKARDTSISENLDSIFDFVTGVSQSDNENVAYRRNTNTDSIPSSSSNSSPQYRDAKGSNSSHVPFVPLSADMFAQKSEDLKKGESKTEVPETNAGSAGFGDSIVNEDREKKQAEKSESWFKTVSEMHNNPDVAGAIPDEDFPDVMPMRKGENRFVVSKKKDRSLTSPAYKRQLAMEQAGNSNTNFVPFHEEYYAKAERWFRRVAQIKDISELSQIPDEDFPSIMPMRKGVNRFVVSKRKTPLERRLTSQQYRKNLPIVSSDPTKNENEAWSTSNFEFSAKAKISALDTSTNCKLARFLSRVSEVLVLSKTTTIPRRSRIEILPYEDAVARKVPSLRLKMLSQHVSSGLHNRDRPIFSIKKINVSRSLLIKY
ncbi:Zinc finger protein VAR3, chloroplastic [Senna tora]|uniref:Zinc finger protein VAR3, chloroplastic n=1 Tax=Senna tora TaxID=362788 RepID=A0A834SDK4_9FABA|nr:Zinc finger protein VAR3, chloroplastic [Senna tora]